ncbi:MULTISPECIES: Stk1 family PASTA domain-containing Ser/Thr kinase [unclassified Oceanobacillus]|uniref:Stk1 family PASTA domain-containing Ser/Thr kinase n=1 Tax=unclassified Oceanobacillus TaxID=2630292 RepID=UPI001BE4F23D|nr:MULTISPECIES: Stk1 family PASTA domain-containing Ser/Thr kinase [unclassified Oceanobacillus]MBT2598758.1 Stk1 family PASTA domain-containing Ser/Thr kinase [Oceanobacillus sp. ISL-74]MBT2651677.1 Stk1 family PASTA domain-containing Ser/Thr kinase [Oceanobacillus sp. ISL-73]
MNKGELLNERYKIIKKIGGGGMANVYLARDTILERDVAVKALRMEYIHDQEFIARFDREAQSATSLSHPNIVNIFDVGEEDQLLYMVMEYVDGMTLKEYIHQHGPIDVPEALDIMKQLTSAIAHAHANEIVHRDIKPQNILINSIGQAKVTDFGIAMALSATALTQTNSILGSVHYLSPEQARGGMATKKSDIYSMGIVLYELLTGKLPFSGQSPVSIALKHLQNNTPSVKKANPSIPQSVENIVLQATAKDPFHRYNSIYELEEALETALDPSRLDEEPFTLPDEVGDETKAIPIITDQDSVVDNNEDTIIHSANQSTKNYPEETHSKDNKKKKKGKVKKEKAKSKNKKPKSKKKKVFWIVFSILLLALLITGITVFATQPKDIPMPDVIEMYSEEAKQILEENNLEVEEEEVFSDEIENGLVVRTDPNAGRTVKEGSSVTIFVSQGQERVEFEDYEGQDFEQVKELLEEEGFTDITSYEKTSDEPVGEIISQIQPEAGSEVVPGETKVIFEISSGPELVSLNNLTGMTKEEVQDYIDRNELTMNSHEEYSDNVDEGRVIRQDPPSGTDLEKGSSVDVYFSMGPEEIPPRSHTVSFTVNYEPQEDGGSENEEGNEGEPPVEQIVRVYIGDANNDISDVYEERSITEEEEFTFTLMVPPDSEAEYKVTRDDEVIRERSVSYEGEED